MSTPFYRVDDEHTGELGREVWVLGPPGTGKTTFLAGSVKSTAQLRGSHNVVVASFTTTAAAELSSRGLPLPKSQVGTLHSLAYRALERPPVADERLDDWNARHREYAMSPSGRRVNVDDGQPVETAMGATDGDQLLNQYDILRNRLVDPEHWPKDVAKFAQTWEAWKRGDGLVDFTDMITMALDHIEVAPSNPHVGFFDEVQDFTPLELALIRKWGRNMERVILAGDDDQSIYGFKGATPDAWLDADVPDSDRIVLNQSWRVPASVHAAAEHWIRQVSRRAEKRYDPRAEVGLVRQVPVSYSEVEQFGDLIEDSLTTTDWISTDDGDLEVPATVMVIAPCGFMIDPIKHEFRRRGVPFHNPYRRTRGDWNPMAPARAGQISSRERLLAYLRLDERPEMGLGDLSRPWTGDDIRTWAHVIGKRGIFRRGAAALLEALPDGEVDFDDLAGLFVDEVELEQAVTPDLGWFERNLLAASRGPLTFPIEVARKRGAKALLQEPRVVLGTIHSVKGGQASVVYLIPDLSGRGGAEWAKRGAPRDGIRRQFYVGMTRARRELAVCTPTGGSPAIVPEELIAGARAGAA